MDSVSAAHTISPQSCPNPPGLVQLTVHLSRQTCRSRNGSIKYLVFNILDQSKPFRQLPPGKRPGKLYAALDAPMPISGYAHYPRGVGTIRFRAAMRSSSGGWVLRSEETVPLPNIGFTMHRAEVLGEIAVVGIRRL